MGGIQHAWATWSSLTVLALAAASAGASAQTRGPSCQEVPVRADYERAWDGVLADKRAALQEGIRDLRAIRDQLERERADGIGGPGSAKEAGIAIAIAVRETTDLVWRMGNLFKPEMSVSDKEMLKALSKIKKISNLAIEDSNKSINGRTKDLADRLPTFIPGVQAARDIRNWTAAKAEVSRQMNGIEASIRKLEVRLADLGGPARAYSIDETMAAARARTRQCTDQPKTTASPPMMPPAATREPIREPPRNPTVGGGSAPIKGACLITGTC
ncbi:hypothetical protein [Azospirillum argentinense]